MRVRLGVGLAISTAAAIVACTLSSLSQVAGFGTTTTTRAVLGQMVSAQVTLKGVGALGTTPYHCTLSFDNATRSDGQGHDDILLWQ